MKIAKPNFSRYQIIKISDISSDIGIVCLVSLVFPNFFGNFNLVRFLFGFTSSLAVFIFSINLRK
jgi:hypothetical protein